MIPCIHCHRAPCTCIRDEAGRQIAPPEREPDPAYLAHQSSGHNKYANVKPPVARLPFHGLFQLGIQRTP